MAKTVKEDQRSQVLGVAPTRTHYNKTEGKTFEQKLVKQSPPPKREQWNGPTHTDIRSQSPDSGLSGSGRLRKRTLLDVNGDEDCLLLILFNGTERRRYLFCIFVEAGRSCCWLADSGIIMAVVGRWFGARKEGVLLHNNNIISTEKDTFGMERRINERGRKDAMAGGVEMRRGRRTRISSLSAHWMGDMDSLDGHSFNIKTKWNL